jgi:hypothetical protein
MVSPTGRESYVHPVHAVQRSIGFALSVDLLFFFTPNGAISHQIFAWDRCQRRDAWRRSHVWEPLWLRIACPQARPRARFEACLPASSDQSPTLNSPCPQGESKGNTSILPSWQALLEGARQLLHGSLQIGIGRGPRLLAGK